jgi:ATP-binding cassette subfamily B protein
VSLAWYSSEAREYRSKLYLALILIFFSVLFGIAPYLLAYNIIVRVIGDGIPGAAYIFGMGGGIIGCLVIQAVLFYGGLDASHDAAYDTLMGMRVKLAHKMTRTPLGDVISKGTGSYKKKFVDDIDSIEVFLAHMIPEGIPYTLVPLIGYILLFIVDWRLAFLSMGSLPLGMMAMSMMMKDGMKRMEPYYASSRRMNGTIVEYVTGMDVIEPAY